MFSQTKKYSSRLKFDEKSFNHICNLLREAGFAKIQVKVPENNTNFTGPFSPENFVALKYNFPAVILDASKNADDFIKVLFINNRNVLTKFTDSTFPSSHSTASQYFVASRDPVRILGLSHFINELLQNSSSKKPSVARFEKVMLLFSSYVIMFIFPPVLLMFFNRLPESLAFLAPYSFGLFILSAASSLYLFFYEIDPGGVYINPFKHPAVSFFRRLLVGDLRNNLIVSFIFSFLKNVLIGVVVFVLGNVVWFFVEEPFKEFLQERIIPGEAKSAP